MMGSCFKIVLNSSMFPAVLFLLTRPMVHGKTVNISLTMTLISVFRRSRIQLIRGTPISITTKKGILLMTLETHPNTKKQGIVATIHPFHTME